ncbi:manganese transport protein MntH [Anatilimnocola aggregata]|uniref:Manganese transport protein MntH n=1 Tax=Anatilimnocola aggregata TaxID=2528021 RepID=A0A517YP18_9BACT|nr:divalent metal cation transporter [Anatilimnocola aggregata]QDU31966.1 manganese transport protein MntH [Anatilimnocola aggregata]
MSSPISPDDHRSTMFENPPQTITGILSRLGPGLIIAGSIVGSGELIATTKTGAEAGFWLLWLILIGCVIKVFVQVELGRDTIIRGKSTMDALGEVPGPRIAGRGNWLIWYYLIMFLASAAQLGGIAGAVGQALAISMPLTEQGQKFNQIANAETEFKTASAELAALTKPGSTFVADPARVDALDTRIASLTETLTKLGPKPPTNYDPQYWATVIAVVTSILLVVGKYKLIEWSTTTMVAAFTLTTVGTVIALQFTDFWAIRFSDIVDGLSFRLPPATQSGSQHALATALATFGIIGVGASELVSYPYWCLEKGYARYTGPRDNSPEWAERARGWLTVLRWDCWCSMVIYTLATVAFYLLGAAILGRVGLNPGGFELVRTLTAMYEPVFGRFAQSLFLVGAFAVLFSTFFVANAGHARVLTDVARVMSFGIKSEADAKRSIRIMSGILPFVCLAIYLCVPEEPQQLVLLSGMVQAFMLPMLAFAALYFRYARGDDRLRPGKVWDAFLWISTAGMFVAAGCLVFKSTNDFIKKQQAKPAIEKVEAVDLDSRAT